MTLCPSTTVCAPSSTALVPPTWTTQAAMYILEHYPLESIDFTYRCRGFTCWDYISSTVASLPTESLRKCWKRPSPRKAIEDNENTKIQISHPPPTSSTSKQVRTMLAHYLPPSLSLPPLSACLRHRRHLLQTAKLCKRVDHEEAREGAPTPPHSRPCC